MPDPQDAGATENHATAHGSAASSQQKAARANENMDARTENLHAPTKNFDARTRKVHGRNGWRPKTQVSDARMHLYLATTQPKAAPLQVRVVRVHLSGARMQVQAWKRRTQKMVASTFLLHLRKSNLRASKFLMLACILGPGNVHLWGAWATRNGRQEKPHGAG